MNVTAIKNAGPWPRRVGTIIGVLLLSGAVALAWRQRESVTQAFDSIAENSAGDLALYIGILLGTVIANFVLTGVLFNILMKPYGKVGWLEMQALMACSTLLNFIPMRAGLLGRVAYHRVCNNIAVADTAKTIVQAAILSASSVGYLALSILVQTQTGDGWIPLWLIAIAPVPVLLVLAALARARPQISRLAAAAAVRHLDLIGMAWRYWAAFALIGSPIASSGALAFACISMAAMMVPFLSNGLGLREWSVGIASPMLTTYQMTLGITADLVNRAAELLITVPAGVIGMVALARLRPNGDANRTE